MAANVLAHTFTGNRANDDCISETEQENGISPDLHPTNLKEIACLLEKIAK